MKIPSGILIYIGSCRLHEPLLYIRGWGESAFRIFTDGYLESFQLGFVYKPLPETKEGIEILLANSWNIRVTYPTRERWEALHPPYMPLQSFPRTSRNFTKFLSYVPRCNRPTRFSEDGGEPSARVSRKGSCPRQRWMLERGRENGGRRRRVFHRVLKLRFWHCLDIGFYEVTEPDEKERERERERVRKSVLPGEKEVYT